MSKTKKIILLLLTFIPFAIYGVLDLIFGDGLEWVIYNDLMFMRVDIYEIKELIHNVVSLTVLTVVLGLGLHSIFRKDHKRDRGPFVLTFTFLAAFWLAILLPTISFWGYYLI